MGRGKEDRFPTAWLGLSSLGGHSLLGAQEPSPCLRKIQAAKRHRGKGLCPSLPVPAPEAKAIPVTVCLSRSKPHSALSPVLECGGCPLHARGLGTLCLRGASGHLPALPTGILLLDLSSQAFSSQEGW